MDFFVPKGCMIFFCFKRLGDFFVPTGGMIFPPQEVAGCFLSLLRLRDFFVVRGCMIFLS